MRSIEVNGVAYVSTATGSEQDCSGCAARGVMGVCGVLNTACGEKPQIFKRADGVDERADFENACVARFAHWREAGNSRNDNGAPCTRESLCWKDDLGNYGVGALNAAWWGWQEGVAHAAKGAKDAP